MSHTEQMTQDIIASCLKEAEGDVGRAVHLLNVQLQALGNVPFRAMTDARNILRRRDTLRRIEQ